ncbi:hypothetical protein HMPREF0201_04093 [Cedecea davisae DSM 4568]|uniref:Uncharacterized protein n=1 Tax=Cedecea davisae DSM 4568 TaxID=566551 RepID=S3ILA8_9ENTR|nr:hypothetical protein HMPREF0201_04093 [Cedecea davisae DSM 4568]
MSQGQRDILASATLSQYFATEYLTRFFIAKHDMIERNTMVESGSFVELNHLFHTVWRDILVNIGEGSAITHSFHIFRQAEKMLHSITEVTQTLGTGIFALATAKTIDYSFRNQHTIVRMRKNLMRIMIVTLAHAMFVTCFAEEVETGIDKILTIREKIL